MAQSFDLSVILSAAKRRYMFFVAPTILIFSVAVTVAYMLPKIYESKAVILIEAQRIPDQLASATVTADPSERIKAIEQRLLARDNLLSIAQQYSLYAGDDNSPSEIVDKMRKAISIIPIDIAKSRLLTQVIGFEVSFRYNNPTTASRVANELVSSMLSQNLETRLSRASETSDFFEQQLENLNSSLLELESKMASFKRDNEAELPETLNSRRESLAAAIAQLDAVNQQLQLLKDAGSNGALADGSNAQQLAFRLESSQLNYESFVERKELLEPLVEKGFVSLKTMSDLERQISQTQIEINSIKSQMAQQGVSADPSTRLALLEKQRGDLEETVASLQQSISRTPLVEIELVAMTREYENLRAEFNQTKSKLTDARIGERLEQDRQAERFEIVEQATVPDQPSAPNRTQIVLAGGGAAVAAGLALVFLLEFLDGSIRTPADLERRLQVRPIAVIPYVTTRQERIRRVTKRGLSVVLFLAVVVAAIAVVHFFITPLDIRVIQAWESVEPLLPASLSF